LGSTASRGEVTRPGNEATNADGLGSWDEVKYGQNKIDRVNYLKTQLLRTNYLSQTGLLMFG
jgi:hypothetical protein